MNRNKLILILIGILLLAGAGVVAYSFLANNKEEVEVPKEKVKEE